METTIPKEAQSLEKMTDFFDLLLKIEPNKKDYIITIDDGKGNDLISFDGLVYGGEIHLFNKGDRKFEIKPVKLFDMLYKLLETSMPTILEKRKKDK